MTPLLATGTRRRIRKSAIPGFGLTMGFTLVYLSLIVLILVFRSILVPLVAAAGSPAPGPGSPLRDSPTESSCASRPAWPGSRLARRRRRSARRRPMG